MKEAANSNTNSDGTCIVLEGELGSMVQVLPYGAPTPSDPNRDSRKCHSDFAPILDSWMMNLQYFSNQYGDYGQVARIVHHGIVNETRARPSFHITGEGIDIKWIDWANAQACRPCNGAADAANPTTHRRIVGVEASLRKYFGVVVARGYNDAHDNHFHADVMCPVGLSKGAATNRFFVRDCIKAFSDTSMTYHGGSWVETTDGVALTALLTSIGMDCFDIFTNISEFLIFLDYIMMHAFADRSAGHFRWGGLPTL